MKPSQLFDQTMTLVIVIQERAKATANNHLLLTEAVWSPGQSLHLSPSSLAAGRCGSIAKTALQGSSFQCVVISELRQ